MVQKSSAVVPVHVGFILDGNRRWAKEKGLPTLEGHRKGYDNLKVVAEHAYEKGVEFVSAYIFSTENWNRTEEEVTYLMKLALKIAEKDARELIKKNVKIVVLGVEERVPNKVVNAFKKVESDSKNNTGGVLALCFNYGGGREITDAIKRIISQNTPVDEISQETISENIYHPEIPPVDLMIRSGGEQRISNFMLWRVAYAELYFSDLYWPDFGTNALDQALEWYKNRNRRFGGN